MLKIIACVFVFIFLYATLKGLFAIIGGDSNKLSIAGFIIGVIGTGIGIITFVLPISLPKNNYIPITEDAICFNIEDDMQNNFLLAKAKAEDTYEQGPINIEDEEYFWVLAQVVPGWDDEEETTENVRISFKKGKEEEKECIVECDFKCGVTKTKSYHSEISFVSDEPFQLEIVEDSAQMYSSLDGLDGSKGKKLSAKAFSEEGALIGYAVPDGVMRGGKENKVTVSIRVHIIREHYASFNKDDKEETAENIKIKYYGFVDDVNQIDSDEENNISLKYLSQNGESDKKEDDNSGQLYYRYDVLRMMNFEPEFLGKDYSRTYYYDTNGELIYIGVEKNHKHCELYYDSGTLICYVDENGDKHILGEDLEYREWDYELRKEQSYVFEYLLE